MRALSIIRQICFSYLPKIHRARTDAILAAVDGLVRGGRLSVTGLGRGLAARTSPKHCIKRVDRLLSNPHFYAERLQIFAALAQRLLAGVRRPVILIDWTKTVPGLWALVAGVPIGGRALPIYVEVYPERRLGNRFIQQRFLRRLRAVVPQTCHPIVITDAGFQSPFIRQVLALGWHYVVRIRGTITMRAVGSATVTNRAGIYASATTAVKDLGTYELYAASKNSSTRPLPTRLVLNQRLSSFQHRWWRKPRSGSARGAMQGAKEPWLLATSLTEESAEAVVRLYATRMQIEETFRDAKNHRFGWSFRYASSSSARRVTLLLLLSCLGMLAITLVGLAAELRGMDRQYQANTVKRRVLSWFVLGSSVVRRDEHRQLHGVLRIGRRHVSDYLRHVVEGSGN
jgi:hypothetical protein